MSHAPSRPNGVEVEGCLPCAERTLRREASKTADAIDRVGELCWDGEMAALDIASARTDLDLQGEGDLADSDVTTVRCLEAFVGEA